jgi:hypothetical protein
LPDLPDTFANPPGQDRTFDANREVVDHELAEGMKVVFDCYGKYKGYCWGRRQDVGIVGGEPQAKFKRAQLRGSRHGHDNDQRKLRSGAIKSRPHRMPQRSVFRYMRCADGATAWKNSASNLDWRSPFICVTQFK